jgi:hypothetical protein
MALTPICLRAAMLARAGTSVGVMVWLVPCREMKAIWSPEGREEMVMGEEGLPHGYLSAGARLEVFSAYSIDIKGLAVAVSDRVRNE